MWVPPKDSTDAMADTILREGGMWVQEKARWPIVLKNHRKEFTQVREVRMEKPSIRLPGGKILMKVTEQENFDTITDDVPDCVQTRLDEFLAGPGKDPNVRVFYIEPLCIEVEHKLIFTSRDDVKRSIQSVRQDVNARYRRMRWTSLPRRAAVGLASTVASVPGRIASAFTRSRREALRVYHCRLECERRKLAMKAAKKHQRNRTNGSTYEEMLALTNPLNTRDVAQNYAAEKELSDMQTRQLMHMAAGAVPWFVAASAALATGISVLGSIAISLSPGVVVCDPAFVAQMPGSNGVLLNIGHFDDVDGVRHIEL